MKWLALGIVSLGFCAGAGADMIMPLAPALDAPAEINFDFYPPSVTMDIYNWYQGPVVSVAYTGKDEAYRPAPGVMIFGRILMEFDLSPLVGVDPTDVDSAVLTLYVSGMQPDTSGPIDLLVGGYAGDGVLDADDYGWPVAADPAQVGVFEDVFAVGLIHCDVTDFVRSLMGVSSWAGFTVSVDLATLPDRATLVQDSYFGANITSADNTVEPAPALNVTLVPEPATQGLLLGGALLMLKPPRRWFW